MKKILYAQSGGATAVINATACGVIEEAMRRGIPVLAGQNGIEGILQERLIDLAHESSEQIAALRYTPGAAFGSCRYRLPPIEGNEAVYQRLIAICQAHDIGYFFYNGGGDSQDTAHKVSQMSQQLGFPLVCMGLPKTIDNDLAHTDNSPGFGSVAKYVAISTREAALDVAGMAASSTKVFILEVMGRHAGWIAAAAGLAKTDAGAAPHLICFPEIEFEQAAFLQQVDSHVKAHGYCVVVASEGIRRADGTFLAESGGRDAFGHQQLGGVAPLLANWVTERLGHKTHWAVSDYLQRAARHIASQTDVDQAYALGQAAVARALAGERDKMLTIERLSQSPYQWQIGTTPLCDVANIEAKMPREYITADGFGITAACRDYLLPLIQGESYPHYHEGLPQYAQLKQQMVTPRCQEELLPA